ncbi:GLutaRedoXin [Datura stramonium]|uniref:GLutaRedoXin n=1 Tax=Datura stramonium TaxID=4076 RepID=A0ABS8T4H1_DATST|nr:GLutaRedoXin [Datura stramonium]
MPRTTSNRNLFPSSSASAASGGSQQPPDGDQINRHNHNNGVRAGVAKLIAENAVVIVCVRQCCMCLMLMHLLKGLGVNPKVFEIEKEETDATLEELSKIKSRCGKDEGGPEGPKKLPVVYLGGELLGGVEKVVEMDIKNQLVPELKEGGALWL